MSYGHRLRKWISNGKGGKNQIKLALFVTTYMGTSCLFALLHLEITCLIPAVYSST